MDKILVNLHNWIKAFNIIDEFKQKTTVYLKEILPSEFAFSLIDLNKNQYNIHNKFQIKIKPDENNVKVLDISFSSEISNMIYVSDILKKVEIVDLNTEEINYINKLYQELFIQVTSMNWQKIINELKMIKDENYIFVNPDARLINNQLIFSKCKIGESSLMLKDKCLYFIDTKTYDINGTLDLTSLKQEKLIILPWCLYDDWGDNTIVYDSNSDILFINFINKTISIGESMMDLVRLKDAYDLDTSIIEYLIKDINHTNYKILWPKNENTKYLFLNKDAVLDKLTQLNFLKAIDLEFSVNRSDNFLYNLCLNGTKYEELSTPNKLIIDNVKKLLDTSYNEINYTEINQKYLTGSTHNSEIELNEDEVLIQL